MRRFFLNALSVYHIKQRHFKRFFKFNFVNGKLKREAEIKCRTFTWFTLCPNAATVMLNNL